MTMSHLEGALKWWDAGMSVVPVVADGSKRPLGSWIAYQIERADRARVEQWFKTAPEQGVGIICGVVSGNLEMTEVEACRMGADFLETVNNHMYAQGVLDLWAELIETEGYCEATPSGGMHVLYRIADEQVPGNTKIAMSENGKITYAETRGEGGFVVVAPSSGRVHKTGDSWSVLAGQIGEVMTITWDQRCRIHAALKDALDERVLPVYERPAGAQAYDKSQGDRPGDAYNADPNVNVHDILTRNGWKYLGKMRGQDSYVHPNSSDMTTHSAVTGHNGSPNLYAWSGLPAQDYYTPFALLTHLEFNGDFSAAGKWLKTQGYGTSGEVLDISDWFTADNGKAEAVVETPAPAMAAPVENQARKVELREWTETGVAHLCVDLVGDRFRHVSEEMGWRVYSDGTWTPAKRAQVNIAVEKITEVPRRLAQQAVDAAEEKEDVQAARRLASTASAFRSGRGINAIVGRFAQQKNIAVEASDFDADRSLLCLSNGTFDLATMKLRDHRPGDMLTKRIDLIFDETATCPGFLRFLEQVVPDPEYRDFLRRALAMTLLGKVREAAFMVLHGPTGCGKSQFVKIAHALLGEYAATAASGTFRESRNRGSNDPYDLHDLRGTRMASMSETSEGDVLNEELLKRITGGDTVKTRALYQSHIEWKPEFTVWVATNFLPKLSVNDDAIWRRVKVVEFPNQFKGDRAEIGIAERLIAEELPGIFNWLLEGVEDYRSVGLKEPGSMAVKLDEYRDDIDPVTQFLAESLAEGTLAEDPVASLTSTELYRAYVEWAGSSGQRYPISQKRFGMGLDKRGYPTHKGTGGVRFRRGLRKPTSAWSDRH